jgi:hypothetical protein
MLSNTQLKIDIPSRFDGDYSTCLSVLRYNSELADISDLRSLDAVAIRLFPEVIGCDETGSECAKAWM